jgi:methanogenic corrinoid protein MtbC1
LVYIRSKTVKGIAYAYLVKSEWNRKKASSIQHTIKYLGRSDSVAINDIPEEYRKDPKILSFLSSQRPKSLTRKESLLEKLHADLFEALCNADGEKAIKIATHYQTLFSLPEFYEDLLTPVMYEVGDLWAQDRLSIVTEHVCSNIGCSLIHTLNSRKRVKSPIETTILICLPEGELHHMGADMLESLLLHKGYQVFNVAHSAPVESIVSSISSINPHLVMISVTLKEHLSPTKRLIRRIREKSKIPIFVGGSATRQLDDQEKQDFEKRYNVSLLSENSLVKIMQRIKVLAITH